MQSKRIEYDSLKTVLQYMDPSLRIRLSLRVPSIRTAEKVVPMKIDRLMLDGLETTINNTNCTMAIYRQYHNPKETPRYHRKTNRVGGCLFDLDEWGFICDPGNEPLTPGDVKLCLTENIFEEKTHFHQQRFIELVVIKEEALRRKIIMNTNMKYNREEDYIEPELRELPNTSSIIAQNEARIQEQLGNSIEDLRSSADLYRSKFLPFYYRENGILPPYTPWIQLSIVSSSGVTEERVAYTTKLFEAMKYFNTLLFGGRRSSICVNELSFVNSDTPFRFAEDMRIKVKHIQSHIIDFGRLKNLIDPSSFPLNVLTIDSSFEDTIAIHQEIVKSAKKLVISNHPNEEESWIPVILNMRNPLIILKYQNKRHDPQTYIALIQHWIDTERSIRSRLSIGFKKYITVMSIFKLVRAQLEVIKMSDRCLTLQMRNGSRLLVSYEPLSFDPDEEYSRFRAGFDKIKEENQPRWTLDLTVA